LQPTSLTIRAQSASGRPIALSSVSGHLTMTEMAMPSVPIRFHAIALNRFAGRVTPSMGGPWALILTVNGPSLHWHGRLAVSVNE
jgi:hypothetical protein